MKTYTKVCEKFNSQVQTTTAEAPWSNDINERHNATLAARIHGGEDGGIQSQS